MNKDVLFLLIIFFLTLPSALIGQVAVLQPGGVVNQSNYDTLGWRTLDEPTVKFWLNQGGPGDSIAVWFQPEGPCSLIALRFYPIDWQGDCLANVWDGSHYDGHIATTDSTDSSGWIGKDLDGEWISGNVIGHSPIGWELYGDHHYWGQFPFVMTEYHLGKWFELPADAGGHKQVDLRDGPIFVTLTLYRITGHGWAAEDEGTVPYHTFYYYNEKYRYGLPGPSGHFGWHIHSPSVWFEAVVKYYNSTGVDDHIDVLRPIGYHLMQNYPNPFNPTTSIEYALPEAAKVRVEVYNGLGQVVDVLVDSNQEAGYHKTLWDASHMASGIYFYRIQANDFIATKRMVLMK